MLIDLANINRILTEAGISYAVVDDSLNVVGIRGTSPHTSTVTEPGRKSLFDVAPEFIGSEHELEAILAGESKRLHLLMVNRETKEGGLIYYNFTVLPHLDEDNAIDGLLFLATDMTPMAEIEQVVTQHRNELSLLKDRLSEQNMQMSATNAELRRVDELKSKFVSIAAHELRSPLSTIAGYLDLLADDDFGALGDQKREFVAAIQRSADRLLETIEKLLDLTRIASGRMDIVLSICDPEEMIQAAIAEVQPLMKSQNQHVVPAIEAGLPPFLCDRNRITQILHNLLSNALKYTPDDGQVQVTVTHAESPGYAQISVIDNGIGIPENDQKNVFETFYRASNVHEVRASGSGLGLNITRSLVELHGGEIWFESEVGVGTSFYVTLPMVDDSASP